MEKSRRSDRFIVFSHQKLRCDSSWRIWMWTTRAAERKYPGQNFYGCQNRRRVCNRPHIPKTCSSFSEDRRRCHDTFCTGNDELDRWHRATVHSSANQGKCLGSVCRCCWCRGRSCSLVFALPPARRFRASIRFLSVIASNSWSSWQEQNIPNNCSRRHRRVARCNKFYDDQWRFHQWT